MKNTSPYIQHWSNQLLAVLTIGLLAGCGLNPTAQKSEQQNFEYLITAKISALDTQEAIALQHKGAIISWNPEQGYAIVGSNEKRLALQGVTVSTNLNAASSSVVALGTSVWGTGTNSWATGTTTWATGTSSQGVFQRNQFLWIATGLSFAQSAAINLGSGITVAVIDTGIDLNHQAFTGRLVASNQMYDFVSNDTIPQEVQGGGAYGHGTAVAGVIAQIAPKAKIMPLRVLTSDGYGDISNVIKAIDWARARNVQVINLSLGTVVSDPLRLAIQAATNQGIFVVIASGNNGQNTVSFPASLARNGTTWLNKVISVASATEFLQRSSFSNVGKDLKLFAPGVNVWSAFPNNQQAYWSGTSIATPMVSAAVALGLSFQPAAITRNDTALNYGWAAPYSCSCSGDSRSTISFLDFSLFLK
jgi:thermitase